MDSASEKFVPFTGQVARDHVDGRHVYVLFDPEIKKGDRAFDVGWYDLAKSPAAERKALRSGAEVRGKAEITHSNLAVIQTLEKIPRRRVIDVVRSLFGRGSEDQT